MKPIVWLGDSRARPRAFPDDAAWLAGHQLYLIQLGREPKDWKPMPSVGLGVNEIRVRAGAACRVIYVAKFVEAIYVLHAFAKRSRKTAREDIELARARFRGLLEERRRI